MKLVVEAICYLARKGQSLSPSSLLLLLLLLLIRIWAGRVWQRADVCDCLPGSLNGRMDHGVSETNRKANVQEWQPCSENGFSFVFGEPILLRHLPTKRAGDIKYSNVS